MVKSFLQHGWKKFSRSVSFSKEMATTLVLAFLTIMIGGYLLALGFVLPQIITKGLGQTDVLGFVHGFLLYYFMFDFMFRYLLQNVPVLDIQPYLHLPIRRSSIIHFLLGKSVFNVLSIFILLLFTPTAVTVVSVQYGGLAAFCWIGGLWFITITVHFLVILYKVKLDDTFWGIFLLLGIFALLGVADYYGWFKLSAMSVLLFSNSLSGFSFLAVTFLLAVSLYIGNFYVFRKSIYTEEIATQSASEFGRGDFGFLKHLGLTGDWIGLELKLILRNKRPRTILFLSAFFLLYGLIFYPNPKYTSELPGFLLFVGIFVTGVFMVNYGQYLFSWQASHFDFTLTRPVSLEQYVNSKYWLLGGITIICFLLSIPYVYFGWKILIINGVMMVFNLGVNIFVIMNLAMWSPKRLDLKKGGAFNIQGVGAAQWLMGLPIFLGPYIFYLPFSFAGYPMTGILVVGLVGLAGIVCRPYLINVTAKRILERKHIIAEGFRKD